MGEQPLFEMVAPAAHVRPALSTARDDSVAGDEQGNLAPAEERRKISPKEKCFHTQARLKNLCVCFFQRDVCQLMIKNIYFSGKE